MRSSCTMWMFVIGAAMAATRAGAQPLNPTINPAASPIQVQQTTEKIAVRPTVVSRTLVNIAFGATALGGNTNTYAGNLGGRFGLNRDRHQLTLEALGTMSGARKTEKGPLEWTARNVISRARYDLFLSRDDALFVALAPRRDIFAGIDIRLQNQIGYSRNVFADSDKHRLWLELGYDLTYDYLSKETTTTDDITTQVSSESPALAPMGTTSIVRTIKTREPGEANWVNSARIFFGYTNRLFSAANLSLGIETLLDFEDKENVRANGLAEFTSSVTQSFKLGLQSRMLFDATQSKRGKQNTDIIAAVQLVYTFDSVETASSAPCPACDCSAQVLEVQKACRAALAKEGKGESPVGEPEPADATKPAEPPTP